PSAAAPPPWRLRPPADGTGRRCHLPLPRHYLAWKSPACRTLRRHPYRACACSETTRPRPMRRQCRQPQPPCKLLSMPWELALRPCLKLCFETNPPMYQQQGFGASRIALGPDPAAVGAARLLRTLYTRLAPPPRTSST